jgi:hypothetical protein
MMTSPMNMADSSVTWVKLSVGDGHSGSFSYIIRDATLAIYSHN